MKKTKNTEQCRDKRCPFHGSLAIRGRNFKGIVKKIIGRRAVIEFSRFVYHKKYERYSKETTKLHAHIPQCMDIKTGDLIKIRECRPLSKITHFVVIEKIK